MKKLLILFAIVSISLTIIAAKKPMKMPGELIKLVAHWKASSQTVKLLAKPGESFPDSISVCFRDSTKVYK